MCRCHPWLLENMRWENIRVEYLLRVLRLCLVVVHRLLWTHFLGDFSYWYALWVAHRHSLRILLQLVTRYLLVFKVLGLLFRH